MSGTGAPARPGRGIWWLLAALVVAVWIAGGPSAAAPPEGGAAQPIYFYPYATGFVAPTDVVATGIPGDERLFVVEKRGTIRIIDADGQVLADPFLTIPPTEVFDDGERGLLGLAFHPDYESNGYLYVNYVHPTGPEGETRIARFSRHATNPNRATYVSQEIVLSVLQPFGNHNAGDLAFGPDGYLYVPLGDGGAADDPLNNGQDATTLLGGLLRLDVDESGGSGPDCGAGGQYTIPADNPFVDGPGGACDELWAIGLRNPWRISFDRLTGDLYIGDVGQGLNEEIDFQPATSNGGENYGWRCYEGNDEGNAYDPLECTGSYTFPIFDYPHYDDNQSFLGCAVTGGYVYRGGQMPGLEGTYIFGDFCSQNFWTLVPAGPDNWNAEFWGQRTTEQPSAFGEGSDGALYVAGFDGTIYRLAAEIVALPLVVRP